MNEQKKLCVFSFMDEVWGGEDWSGQLHRIIFHSGKNFRMRFAFVLFFIILFWIHLVSTGYYDGISTWIRACNVEVWREVKRLIRALFGHSEKYADSEMNSNMFAICVPNIQTDANYNTIGVENDDDDACIKIHFACNAQLQRFSRDRDVLPTSSRHTCSISSLSFDSRTYLLFVVSIAGH